MLKSRMVLCTVQPFADGGTEEISINFKIVFKLKYLHHTMERNEKSIPCMSLKMDMT